MPTLVQSAGTNGSGDISSINVTLPGATTAGNLILIYVACGVNSAGNIQTPSGFTSAKDVTGGAANQESQLFYQANTAGGTTSYTVTTSSAGGMSMIVEEWSGIVTVSPLDQTASNNATSANPDTGTTASTTQANELWVGLIDYTATGGASPSSPTNGFAFNLKQTSSGGTANCCVNSLNKIVSATGTANTGCTINASHGWTGIVATFKATASGGTTTPTKTAHAQWPNPLHVTQRPALTPKDPHLFGNTQANHATLAAIEMFFGEADPTIACDAPVVSKNYGMTLGPLRVTQRQALLWYPHTAPNFATNTDTGGSNENDLQRGISDYFFGQVDQVNTPFQVSANVNAGLSATLTPGGSFVGPSASVLQFAELGQSQVYGAVNVNMALSASETPGGMFVGPSAQVLQTAIAGAPHQVLAAVNVSMGVSASAEVGGSFVGSSALVLRIATQEQAVVLYAAVNVTMALSTSAEIGGAFVGASALVRQIALEGAPHQVMAAVNVSMALSTSAEMGGSLVGPSAQVLLTAEHAPTIVQGVASVTVSMGLSAQPTSGGMFIGPSALVRQIATQQAVVVYGAVNVSMGLSAAETPGGSFVGPAAQMAFVAILAARPVVGVLLTPVGMLAAGVSPGGALGAGTSPGGGIAFGASPSGILSVGTEPGGSITGPQEPGGSIVRK